VWFFIKIECPDRIEGIKSLFSITINDIPKQVKNFIYIYIFVVSDNLEYYWERQLE
jgi:hypothetical protein